MISISKNIIHDISHSLLSKTTCGKTVLQLSADELQGTRNALHDKQIFLVVDISTLSGIQYLNILVGSFKISHVSYLYDCQPLRWVLNSNSIAQVLDDADRSLRINRNSLYLLLSNAKYMEAAGAILKSLFF